MDSILFLAHTEPDGTLARPALEALTAARTLAAVQAGTPFVAGLVGPKAEAAAAGLGSSGTARALIAAGDDFAQARYATDAAAAEAICRTSGATLVVAPATSRWARALPGVAFRIGGRIDTHITTAARVDDAVTVRRWYYRQRMEAVVQRTTRPWLLLIEPGCYPAWTGRAAPIGIEQVAVNIADAALRTKVSGLVSPVAGEQTIRPDAALLFVAGAGWTKKQPDGSSRPEEAEKLILNFLQATRASLGGSKSLVDLTGEGQAVLRFMTHLNQIGQTGSTPRHPKGLSTCCHGEEPHVVGWRFVKERRAVNLDPNCGWARGKADVLYVADAFDVLAKVNALLATRTGGKADG
jgi:electron transfer flavoprotein alpha subunit